MITNTRTRFTKPFVFVHIGKTAGTSIELALCNYFNIDFELTEKNPETGEWWKHSWARSLKKDLGVERWAESFVFSIVRNPYDMLLSLYSMYTQYPEYTNPTVHADLYHPWNDFENFEHFVLSMGRGTYTGTNKHKFLGDSAEDLWEHHSCIQTKFLYWRFDDKKEPLADYVGRYETLEESWETILKEIGMPPIKLPKHGATVHEPWEDVYTEEMKEIVYNYNKSDFENFNYSA